ncbi:hypothetical protein J1N35_024663 [Gossypium stocksii]|uniref:Uncharacterized protein n=1 Tax=Gossypium stocksii TaxID=47602 RepID=A0A9D3V5K7_9ROSI|nr:hypothetical protein J1N35_024663 [Gossypium stocksii]
MVFTGTSSLASFAGACGIVGTRTFFYDEWIEGEGIWERCMQLYRETVSCSTVLQGVGTLSSTQKWTMDSIAYALVQSKWGWCCP